MKTAEIKSIIGRLKGIRFTDLTQSSFDLAIVLIANSNLHEQHHEIKINPTFLAKELGMDIAARPQIDLPEEPVIKEGETDKQFEARLLEYTKIKDAAMSEMNDFVSNRSKLSRKWLRDKANELINDGAFVRVSAEDRKVGGTDATGYGDSPDSLTPHKASGLYLTKISVLDEDEVMEYKLSTNQRVVDIDDELKIRKYEDSKRAMLRAKADAARNAVKLRLNGSPKPEEPALIDENEDDSSF